jgi:hypothetical protein
MAWNGGSRMRRAGNLNALSEASCPARFPEGSLSPPASGTALVVSFFRGGACLSAYPRSAVKTT